jgi:hypothetical protein
MDSSCNGTPISEGWWRLVPVMEHLPGSEMNMPGADIHYFHVFNVAHFFAHAAIYVA